MDDYNQKESLINEAFLKMQRLHESQRVINMCKLNLLAYNSELGKYYYEIMIMELSNIRSACWSKMKDEDQKYTTKVEWIIQNLIDLLPIYEIMQTDSLSGKKKEKILNKKNWNLLREVILNYEKTIMSVLGKTGYDSPNKPDATKSIIQM